MHLSKLVVCVSGRNFESRGSCLGMARSCFWVFRGFWICTDFSVFYACTCIEQLCLVGRFCAFAHLWKDFFDFFYLHWPQIFAVRHKSVWIVWAAHIDVLEDLHSQVSQLFVFLGQVILNHFEYIPEIDLFDRSLLIKSFVYHVTWETGNLLACAFHSLYQFRE